MKTWYRLRAARKTAELLIYDEIGGFGKTSVSLLNELAALGDLTTINVRINSPGGDVSEGVAMHNALARHPAKVITHIDGLCASAATVVALAGDEVRMADNALFMIHEPWTVTGGNAEAFQKQADLLDVVAEQIVGIYARKTGADPADIRQWMQAETWYTADQALDVGFVDFIDAPLKMAAMATQHDLTRFKNSPILSCTETVVMTTENAIETPDIVVDIPTPPPVPEAARALDAISIVRFCNTANEPKLAEILLATPHTAEQVQARIAQAAAVRKVCAIARQPDLAPGLIAAGADEAAAKLATWDALVTRDESQRIDATTPANTARAVTRAQFDTMTPQARRAHLAASGQVSD